MNVLKGTSAQLRGLLPHSLEEAVPAVGVARRYERSSLRPDLIAGAIVAVVAVPSSLAMGELAGLPVVFGLYATFLPLVGYAIFGSSRHLVVGPDATMATLTAAIVAPMAIVDGTTDPARYAALAAALALTMGVVLVLAGTTGGNSLGFFRLGRLSYALRFSRPLACGARMWALCARRRGREPREGSAFPRLRIYEQLTSGFQGVSSPLGFGFQIHAWSE